MSMSLHRWVSVIHRPVTFQRIMYAIFRDVKCVFVYLGAIFVSSHTQEQHYAGLAKVLAF